MHHTNKPFYHTILFSALIMGVSFTACRNDVVDEDTLAVIGKRKISTHDFSQRFRETRQRIGDGVPDSYQFRQEILRSFVEEEILIAEAKARDYHQDRAGLQERERIEIQELLKAYTRKFIASKIEVTEAELQQLFVNLNTKITARHLYAPTRAGADSLYQLLQDGATFEEVAEDIFQDPELRESGGLLGDIAFEDMEPEFEEIAFGMQAGEVSEPVRTSDGYSIIKVDARFTKPLRTETEYAKHRQKLYAYWQNRRLKKAMQAFSDSLGESLQITFNQPVLKELYKQFRAPPFQAKEGTFFLQPDDKTSGQILVESAMGVWTVGAFREKALHTSQKQRDRIMSELNFREFISGLIIREAILRKARNAGLDRNESLKSRVQTDFDLFLLSRMEEWIREDIAVPEDSLRDYYDHNADRFSAPPKVRLREIVLSDAEMSEKIGRLLREGASFSELAAVHSERKWSADLGGDLGYLEPVDLGKWSTKIFGMGAGDIAGPLQMDSKLVFLKCVDKIPAKQRSFEQARPEVEKTLEYLMWQEVRQSRIAGFRTDIDYLEVFPEKLKTLRIN